MILGGNKINVSIVAVFTQTPRGENVGKSMLKQVMEEGLPCTLVTGC